MTSTASAPDHDRHLPAPAISRWLPTARIGRAAMVGILERLEYGAIELVEPSGQRLSFGDDGPRSELRIHDDAFYTRVLVGGDLGFAESYMAGEWTSDDLTTLLYVLGRNERALGGLQLRTATVRQWLTRWWHRARANSESGARRNIADHYDLGNRMFAAFLDRSMTYSCADFSTGSETLETAQQRKLDRVIDAARIGAGDHVLEVGCGWGSFAIRAVERTGCRVTGVTLSEQQKEWAEREIARHGMQDRIEVRLADYRRLVGAYDHIVSIEMIEAVGREHLPEYFRVCERLLKPGGRMVLQAITIDDALYESYSRRADFIQRHVFPGGHLPSQAELARLTEAHTELEIAGSYELAGSYERTLAEWRERFDRATLEVRAAGMDDTFRRKWQYYFCYCEAGFRLGRLGTVQLTLQNPPALRLVA